MVIQSTKKIEKKKAWTHLSSLPQHIPSPNVSPLLSLKEVYTAAGELARRRPRQRPNGSSRGCITVAGETGGARGGGGARWEASMAAGNGSPIGPPPPPLEFRRPSLCSGASDARHSQLPPPSTVACAPSPRCCFPLPSPPTAYSAPSPPLPPPPSPPVATVHGSPSTGCSD